MDELQFKQIDRCFFFARSSRLSARVPHTGYSITGRWPIWSIWSQKSKEPTFAVCHRVDGTYQLTQFRGDPPIADGVTTSSKRRLGLGWNGAYLSVGWAKQSVPITCSLMGKGLCPCPSYYPVSKLM